MQRFVSMFRCQYKDDSIVTKSTRRMNWYGGRFVHNQELFGFLNDFDWLRCDWRFMTMYNMSSQKNNTSVSTITSFNVFMNNEGEMIRYFVTTLYSSQRIYFFTIDTNPTTLNRFFIVIRRVSTKFFSHNFDK